MGKGYKHGGSGGANPLNFTVKTYPSEVELKADKPKVNTIGVITTTTMTSWVFFATEPSEPEVGMVWLSLGNSSPVEFNALKKNTLMVYPLSAKQYEGGKWVDKTAYSYQNSEWISWIIYLYNLGDECADITGGWKVVRESGGGSFTNSGEELIIQSGGASNGVTCYTNNKVNLTNAKTVHFSVSTVTGTSGTCIGFLVTNGNSSWNDWENLAASTFPDNDTVVKEYTVDVTNVSGEYYIGFICYGGSDRSVGCNNIWFS